jgi:multiple sugar transport system ATP-binding protein
MSGLPNVAPGATGRVHVPPMSIHMFAADSGHRLN